MNTNIYMKSKSMLATDKGEAKYPRSYLAFALIVGLFMSISSGSVLATQGAVNVDVVDKTMKVLKLTESAIKNLDSNPDDALSNVEAALNKIKLIESSYAQNTLTELSRDKSAGTSASHTHYFPKLDVNELSDHSKLPTLSKKIKSDVLYKGNLQSEEAWFDYTFAKASLVTVREAINAGHSVEAMSNLKRVFEAIYISPEFNVSEKLS